MAWCKLFDSFREHYKPKRLARELGIRRAEARGLISGLLSWALIHAVDGDLRNHTVDEIEEGADWEGEPGKFVQAACKLGILDKKRSGYIIHNFLKRAGSYKKAQQKQKERVRKRGATVARQGGDGSATVALRGAERRGEEQRGDEQRGCARDGSVKPVQLGPGGNGEPWCWGAPIATFGDFLEATQELRGAAAGWSPTAELRATLEGGPIGADEYAGIIQRARDSAKGPAWVASGIYRERERAADIGAAPPPEPKNPNIGWMDEYEDEEDEKN